MKATSKKKVELMVKPLESKVTPYCCPWGMGCDGELQFAGYMGDWTGSTIPAFDCVQQYGGKLAAVADY